MTPTTKPPIEGLPVGVELVGLHVAGENDYELVGNVILKGVRPLASSGVIVKPADGYVFVAGPAHFDVVLYKNVQTYLAARVIATVTVNATVSFAVNNQVDLDAVNAALAALKSVSGFVSLNQS